MRRLVTSAIAGIVALLGASAPTLAQAPGQTPPGGQPPNSPSAGVPAGTASPDATDAGPQRGGIMFGVTLGVGGLNSDECYEGCGETALYGSIHVGTSLTPKLALVGEFLSGVMQVEEDFFGDQVLVNHRVLTIGLRYWAGDKLWLSAAIGTARLSVNSDAFGPVEREADRAFAFGAAYEFLQGKRMVLDLQLRLAVSGYEDDESVQSTLIAAGLNWY